MTKTLEESLIARLEALSRVPSLLVATDFDGTLAPIVPRPEEARPLREAIVALNMLSGLSSTHVAVISGRSLEELAELTGLPGSVHLVGSHGSEFDPGFAASLNVEQRELRKHLLDEVSRIAAGEPGFTIEVKPASVAFHYRNADEEAAERANEQLLDGPARLPGVYLKRGKKVLELSVVHTNKGRALEGLRARLGSHAVLFVGDDVTDEDAFDRLRGPDLGVKVGPGDSVAPERVADPGTVARLLARLAELRAAWVLGGEAVPIAAHSFLSDQRTAALVTPQARITWLCLPQLDSEALFAELVGGPEAGYFSIGPVDGAAPEAQSYVGDSLVLETRWPGFTITDCLDCSDGRPRQRAGRSDLIRLVEGAGRVRIEFAPRLDFGRRPTRIEVREGGLEILDSHDPIVLRAPGLEWQIVTEGPHHKAIAEHDLAQGPLALTLRHGSATLRALAADGFDRTERTRRYWEDWVRHLVLPEEARAEVLRSALMLKGLVHGPTGAIAAAATTSLPETIGGVRNWDYRFCWPRDAAIAAQALVKLGSPAEAMQFLDWMLLVVERSLSPESLRPLYTLHGQEPGTEGEIGELSGYAGSRPVRIGNAASRQVQLDVFGPVVELVCELARRDAPLSPRHWRIVEAMVHAVEARWHQPDHGIWEIRSDLRHHVHSKVMCWLTVDRALEVSRLLHDREPEPWKRLQEAISADILARGYDEGIGAFTAAYDLPEFDASTLWVGLSGLLPPDDPRFVQTVDAVERELRKGPGVYRYRYDDGLPGFEGAFLLCTCWLVQAQLLVGRRADAESLFRDYLALAGPTGLMAEEFGTVSLRSLGNVPQAYSHAGLIECALALQNGTGSEVRV